MRLKYTGIVPTVFVHSAVSQVEPGDIFSISDEEANGYIHRADIEVVEDPEPPVEEKKVPEPIKQTTTKKTN